MVEPGSLAFQHISHQQAHKDKQPLDLIQNSGGKTKRPENLLASNQQPNKQGLIPDK